MKRFGAQNARYKTQDTRRQEKRMKKKDWILLFGYGPLSAFQTPEACL
jgi:hypothetical protein